MTDVLFSRRRALAGLGVLAGTLAAVGSRPALAQGSGYPASAGDWPTHSIRIIIPFAPGGGTDILGRLVLPSVQERLRQSIVIDNRPGAGSVIGTEAAARAMPDGYTFLMVDTSFQITPLLQPRLPYDPERDFTPVSLMASGPVVLAVNARAPWRTLAEFVAAAKAQPGTLAYASGGNGSASHLTGELLKIEAGIDLLHVAYRGGSLAMNDVIAGSVPALFSGVSTAAPHQAAGRLRLLAITGEQRHSLAPDVPTFAESGLPGMEASSFWGMLAPRGVPAHIINRMAGAVQAAMRAPQFQSRLTELGFIVLATDPAGYGENIRSVRAKWAEVVRRANIKL